MVKPDKGWFVYGLQSILAFLLILTEHTVETTSAQSLTGSDTNRSEGKEFLQQKVHSVYGKEFIKGLKMLQMKKIGLEIPESTRKDMESSVTKYFSMGANISTASNNQSTSQRRKLQCCNYGEYYISNLDECRNCSDRYPNCQECDEFSCTMCQMTYFHNGSDCIYSPPNCSPGQYRNGSNCYNCSSHCLNCTSYSDCYSCESGYNVSGGYCNNSSGNYSYNNSSGNYYFNITNCSVHQNATRCGQCYNGSKLQDVNGTNGTMNRICVPCPYGTTSNGSLNCDPCTPPCTQCNGTSYNCTSCEAAHPLLTGNGTCLDNCTSTTYYNSSFGSCQSCAPNCSNCTGGSYYECTECSIGGMFIQASDSQCRYGCDPGTYQVNSTHCGNCSAYCIDCNDGNCTNCSDPYYLSNHTCVGSCPAGEVDIGNRICETDPNNTCAPQCLTCFAPYSSSACTTCDTNIRVLNTTNNHCMLICNSSQYYASDSDTCPSCDPSCYNCSGPGNGSCYSCTNGFYKDLTTLRCVASCPSSTFNSSTYYMSCEGCHPNCSTCSGLGEHNCTSCGAGQVLTGGSCNSSCAQSEYNIGNGTCYPCSASCLSCYGPYSNNCSSCFPGNFSFNGQCNTSCPNRFFANTSVSECQPCGSLCLTCSSPNNNGSCTSCDSGRQLDAYSHCAVGCLGSEYYDSYNDTCAQCHPTCNSTCVGPNPENCSACPDYSNNGTCVTSCPSNTYAIVSNKTCEPCYANCSTCFGGGFDQCVTCNSTLYLSNQECVTSCPAGHYPDANRICVVCDVLCQNCNGSGNSSCTSCNVGDYLNPGGQCLSTCPVKYFANTSTFSCEACHHMCDTCSSPNDPLACLTCEYGRRLRADFFCELNCSSGQYYNSPNDSCNACHASCTSCTGPNATDCSSCPDYSNNGSCVTTCPSGTYPVIATKTCLPCNSSCLTCNGAAYNQCLTCNSTLYLTVSHECKSNCSDREYPDGVKICHACNAGCHNCTGAAYNQCSSCDSGTFLAPDGQCLATCPIKFIGNTVMNVCEGCAAKCETCSVAGNPYSCLTCESGRQRNPSNYCEITCSSGYYYNLVNDTCDLCYGSCTSCTGPNAANCSSCPDYSNNGSCVTTCPAGTYAVVANKTCQPCNSSCLTCNGAAYNQCLTCNSTLYLTVAKECKSSCNVHESPDANNTCHLCHATCDTCANGSTNSCTSCNNSLYLNPNMTCLPSCPSQYFASTSNRSCDACHPSCESCSAANSNYSCVTCVSGRRLRTDNFCELNCSSTQYYDNATDICSGCNSLCGSCLGPNVSHCTSCSATSYYHLGQCLVACPNSTYPVVANMTCEPCHSSCLTCNGSADTQCLTCNSTLYLTGTKQCKSSCNLHEFADASKLCHACDSSCNSCNSSSSMSCLSCSSPNYLTPNGSCALECPEHYTKNPVAMNCSACASTCLRCSSPANQYACIECESSRVLREDKFCTKPCAKGLYYDEPSDICLLCHSKCASCTGESETQCLTCANGLFRSYTDLCVAACPVDSYLNGTTCFQCHRSCKTCTGTSPNNCTSCVASQVLTVSGYCKDGCDDREFKNSQGVCEGCHSTCGSCNSTGEEGCTGCLNSSITSLSKKGSCVNCLDQADSDPETCWYSVRLTLTKPSTKAVSLTASTTVRLTFQNESLFNSRLDESILTRVLNLSVSGVTPQDWKWEIRFTSGEIIFDLFFSGGQEGPAVLTVTPNQKIILTNSAGIAELIFKNQSTKFEIQIRKAPDAQMMGALAEGTAQAENIGSGFSAVSSAMSVLAVAATSGLGAPLLKILRIFKLVSRLRLINIFFGSYLELFLQAVGNLYKIGGDDINLSTIKLAPNSRGKLDMYAVSVVSADAVGVKYAIYYLSVAVRVYRSSIRKYVSQRGSMTMVDSLLDNVGERCSTLLLIMVGIDIFFYSLRCVSHMDKLVRLDFMAHCSLLLSILTIMLFSVEFILLLDLNRNTTFHSLRRALRRNRVVLKRAAVLAPSDDNKLIPEPSSTLRKLGKIPVKKRTAVSGSSMLTRNNSEKNLQAIVPSQYRQASNWDDNPPNNNQQDDDLVIHTQDDDTVDPNVKKYLYGYRQQKRVIDNPSAEQFFGNGIKLHKLRTPEGRYYNTVALAKLFVFEPLFINLQMFSTAQVLSIFLLQCVFVYLTMRAGIFAKVFSSPLSYIALILNEVAMLVFLGVGTLFQLVGGEMNVSAAMSTNLQFIAVGAVSLACVIGFVEFSVSMIAAIISAFRNRKLKMAQKAVNNHRDEMKSVRHRVIGRDLPGAEPPVPPVDADMSSSVADIKANQVGQSAKPVLGKTRLAPGKRLSRPPLQPLARK